MSPLSVAPPVPPVLYKKVQNANVQWVRWCRSARKKNELIGDLITIFAIADIPLQKVDAIRPFLRKHVNNGGSIPNSSTLRETHLPRLMPEIGSAIEKVVKNVPSVNIILDETTDNIQQNKHNRGPWGLLNSNMSKTGINGNFSPGGGEFCTSKTGNPGGPGGRGRKTCPSHFTVSYSCSYFHLELLPARTL